MRILFLSPIGAIGGAEAAMLRMLARLRIERPGIAVKLIAFGAGDLVGAAASLGAATEVVPLPPALAGLGDSGDIGRGGWQLSCRIGEIMGAFPSLLPFVRRLRRAVHAWRPQVVHSNGVKCHMLSPWVVPPSSVVVWHIQDFLGQRPLAGRFLSAVSSPDVAIAISHGVADDVQRLFGARVPVCVLANAVDLERFAPGVADPTVLDGVRRTDRVVRVGLVATYARWKGHDVFLRAAARLLLTLPSAPVAFYVVGSAIYRTAGSQFSRQELLDLSRSLGLHERVSFVEHQRDVASIYRALDIVVHASTRREPFGLTISEAMACGRPVIVSGSPGAAEWGAHGEDHIRVAEGDASALATEMARLIERPTERIRLGANARRTAIRSLGDANLVTDLLSCYATSHAPAVGPIK